MLSLKSRALIARAYRALDAADAEVNAAMRGQVSRAAYSCFMRGGYMPIKQMAQLGVAMHMSPRYQAVIQQWAARTNS